MKAYILKPVLIAVILNFTAISSRAAELQDQVVADFQAAWGNFLGHSTSLVFGSVGVYALQPSDRWAQSHVGTLDGAETLKRTANEFLGAGGPGALLGLGTIAFGGAEARRFGFLTLEALAGVTLLTHTIKFSVGRARPNGADNLSFPSGHTSSIFSTAAMVHATYGWWAGLPMYGLGLVTAASRIAGRDHWPSDTLGGAILGVAVGWSFAELQSTSKAASQNKNSSRSFHYIPIVGDDRLILMISRNF